MIKQNRFWKAFKVLVIMAITLAIAMLVFFFYNTAVTTNLDPYVYELPFKPGTGHRVVQGYGGLFSHRYIAAIDFEMPEGTPVYAARGGIIYSYKEDSDEGGPFSTYKDKANFIIIKHDDGSFGCYWHLKKNSVLIKNGAVAAGEPIALSGATGQVLRAHLHFSVKRVLNYAMNSFVQTKFNTSEGKLLLKMGHYYERPLQ